MNRLFEVLEDLSGTFLAENRPWALIGGLAVSVRGEVRTTRDIDVVLSVADDREAERLVRSFQEAGFRVESLRDDVETLRLAMVRLVPPGDQLEGFLVDLFFAFSGLEGEVVAAAQPVEIRPGLEVPVATLRHLLVLKCLAGRGRDQDDFSVLLRYASTEDVAAAREDIRRLAEKGLGRSVGPENRFEEWVADFDSDD